MSRSVAGGSPAREGVLVALAAVTLALALGWSYGAFHPGALALATGAAGMAVIAARGSRRSPVAPGDARPFPITSTHVLGIGIAASLVVDLVTIPGFSVREPELGALRPVIVAAAALVATWRWRRATKAVVRARFPLALALTAAASVIVLRASFPPEIDVWYFDQLGSTALWRGFDPYLVAYPNLYDPNDPDAYYAQALLSADGATVLANPYPPLTLVAGGPAALLGDVRWTMVVCVIAAAWMIRALGRGARDAELAALLVVLQPRTLFVLEQSWTEPMVLAAMMLVILAVDRWRERRLGSGGSNDGWYGWVTTGTAGALALGTKQYTPLLLLPVYCAAPLRHRWKAAVLAVAGVAALAVPFLWTDASSFWRSVVMFQLMQPFREGALSWPAAVVWLGGPRLPSWPAFALAGLVLALLLRRESSLAHAVTTAAAAWLVLVLFNKQAFCNYYWAAVGILCAATALHARGSAPEGSTSQISPEP
jgi:hypothetical protein